MLKRIVSVVAAVASAALASPAQGVDEPPHEVVRQDGAFALRRYAPMITASVVVDAERRKAPNAGFPPLGEYIFGANAPKSKIEMTAPVIQRGVEIEMTAPVVQSAAADGGGWRISFVMPQGWTMQTLPAPLDPRVSLVEEPERLMAVARFRGSAPTRVQDQKLAALRAWIAEQGFEAVGSPAYAYYNPPWTPPPLRRNEVMVEVREVGQSPTPPGR